MKKARTRAGKPIRKPPRQGLGATLGIQALAGPMLVLWEALLSEPQYPGG